MTITQLTPAQHAVLTHAVEHAAGEIEWFPDNIKGGSRKKVLDGLVNRGFAVAIESDWFVATEGFDALGVSRPEPTPAVQAKVRRTRDNSKQATVIAMLKRPEGATIPQICETTGWKQHTVRGTFAGAFKKKLGLDITSTNVPGGQRVYQIAS